MDIRLYLYSLFIKHEMESTYLFSYKEAIHKDYKRRHFQDHHKIFFIKTEGDARPKHEIKYLAYYSPDSDIKLSSITKELIDKYLEIKKAIILFLVIFRKLYLIYLSL